MTATWMDRLKPLAFAAKPLRLKGEPDEPDPVTEATLNVVTGLPRDLKYATRDKRREFIHGRGRVERCRDLS